MMFSIQEGIIVTTLFEKLGGKGAVDLAVDRFYERVLNDERIRHFFENVDMNRQRGHQKAFLTYAFGGASQYDGSTMREAHRHLVENMGLNGKHFDAVVENLMETLKELGISDELIGEVAAVAAAPEHRREVLNRSS
jgi:hemoglobin